MHLMTGPANNTRIEEVAQPKLALVVSLQRQNAQMSAHAGVAETVENLVAQTPLTQVLSLRISSYSLQMVPMVHQRVELQSQRTVCGALEQRTQSQSPIPHTKGQPWGGTALWHRRQQTCQQQLHNPISNGTLPTQAVFHSSGTRRFPRMTLFLISTTMLL